MTTARYSYYTQRTQRHTLDHMDNTRRHHPAGALSNVNGLSYLSTLFYRFLILKYTNNRYLTVFTITSLGYRYIMCCYDGEGPKTDNYNVPSTTIWLRWLWDEREVLLRHDSLPDALFVSLHKPSPPAWPKLGNLTPCPWIALQCMGERVCLCPSKLFFSIPASDNFKN